MLIYLTLGLGVAGVPDRNVISTLTDITEPRRGKKVFRAGLGSWGFLAYALNSLSESLAVFSVSDHQCNSVKSKAGPL